MLDDFRKWAAARVPVLVAGGFLLLSLLILIAISLARTY